MTQFVGPLMRDFEDGLTLVKTVWFADFFPLRCYIDKYGKRVVSAVDTQALWVSQINWWAPSEERREIDRFFRGIE